MPHHLHTQLDARTQNTPINMYRTYFRKKENIQIRNQRRNGLNNSTMKTLIGKQFTHPPFGQQKT